MILAYPGLTVSRTLLAAFSPAAACLALFALLAVLVFIKDNTAALPGLLMVSLFVPSTWQVAAVAIERWALFHPVANAVAAAASVLLPWGLLGSPGRARRPVSLAPGAL